MAHSGNSKQFCMTQAQTILIRKKKKMGPFCGEARVIRWLVKMFDFILRIIENC